MSRLTKTILFLATSVLIASALLPEQAQADPITGAITFAGGVTLDTGSVNTATMVTDWINTQVKSRSGAFAAFLSPNAPVAFAAPWSFNTSTTILSFWTAGAFTFDLTQSAIVFQGGGFLYVSGTGLIHCAGYDDTIGTWSFTTQDPAASGIFSFSAAGASTPDSGATVGLLGLALAGIEAVRRRTRAKN